MIRWPIPYLHAANDFEVVGRYIAQTVLMERFIDMILLDTGTSARRLKRAKLASKIEGVRAVIQRPELNLGEWQDLPEMMTKVARHRNLFAHRMMERGALPPHYGQGIPYRRLPDDELREQEQEAFVASEVCRQLCERLSHGPLNPDVHFGRSDHRVVGGAGEDRPLGLKVR
jgi:hypothetical protein